MIPPILPAGLLSDARKVRDRSIECGNIHAVTKNGSGAFFGATERMWTAVPIENGAVESSWNFHLAERLLALQVRVTDR